MAKEDNLVSLADRTTEEQREIARMGGNASGKSRRRNKLIRDSLQRILNSGIKLPPIDPKKPIDKDVTNLLEKLESIGVNTKELPLVDLMNLGQVLGAVFGKNENYKTLIEMNGELIEEDTPELKITTIDEIVDNSNLKKVLYEENKPKGNAN